MPSKQQILAQASLSDHNEPFILLNSLCAFQITNQSFGETEIALRIVTDRLFYLLHDK